MRAGGDGQQAHDGLRRHALAAARLADEADCLARCDGKAHILDDADRTRLRVEPDTQILDGEERGIIHSKTMRGKQTETTLTGAASIETPEASRAAGGLSMVWSCSFMTLASIARYWASLAKM